MKSIAESSSERLRSSVSSPGIPNTYLTPSASRHSTNRSDALRSLTAPFLAEIATSARLACPATLGNAVVLPMSRARVPFPPHHDSEPPHPHDRARPPDGLRRRVRGGRGALHDPRRRLRPRRRDEPVRRDGLRRARLGLRPDPGALLLRHGARQAERVARRARAAAVRERLGVVLRRVERRRQDALAGEDLRRAWPRRRPGGAARPERALARRGHRAAARHRARPAHAEGPRG